MGENSAIAWCHHTFNPWIGCQKVSAGCDNCFAETLMDKRYHRVTWGPHGERVRTSPENWRLPLRWARKAREALEDFEAGMLTLRPERPRVFCASLADVFDNKVPGEWRHDLFNLIWATPELDWLLLTKRPENVARMIDDALRPLMGTVLGPWYKMGWPNVWLGFTAEDQQNFDRRWSIMREVPAEIRFCSYEPAIGPLVLPPAVELMSPNPAGKGLHWLICGGESGPGYRFMPPAWAEDALASCQNHGVAFFMKQMSGRRPIPEDLMVRQFPR